MKYQFVLQISVKYWVTQLFSFVIFYQYLTNTLNDTFKKLNYHLEGGLSISLIPVYSTFHLSEV